MRQTTFGAADLSAPGDLASNAASFAPYLRAANVTLAILKTREAATTRPVPHPARHVERRRDHHCEHVEVRHRPAGAPAGSRSTRRRGDDALLLSASAGAARVPDVRGVGAADVDPRIGGLGCGASVRL